MSSQNTHEKLRQSIQGNLRRYEAIALNMAITFELEDFITQRGISKQELAKAAGVSPSYLSQVFSGDKLLNLPMLAGISQEYKVRFKLDIEQMEVNRIKEIENFIYPILVKKQPNYSSLNGYLQFDMAQERNWKRAAGGDSGCEA